MAQPPLLENGGEWTRLATNSSPPPRVATSRTVLYVRSFLVRTRGFDRCFYVSERNDSSMDRHDPIDLQPEFVHILYKVSRERRHWWRRRWRVRCGRSRRIINIRFDDQTFHGKIHHQHRRRVDIAGDVIDLDSACRILQDTFVTDRFHNCRFRVFTQRVGGHGMRTRRHGLNERLVSFMSDDGCPFSYRSADSAGMVKVMVRVDHIFDRLIRYEFLGLGDYRGGTYLMLRSFDQYQMIGKLDQYAVVALSREVPQSLANWFNGNHGRRGGGRCLRGLDVRRCG